jgi:hypothetical protein
VKLKIGKNEKNIKQKTIKALVSFEHRNLVQRKKLRSLLKPKFNNIFVIYFFEIDDFSCESSTFNGIIDNLGISIDFFFNGHARLGYGLLNYTIFKESGQSV